MREILTSLFTASLIALVYLLGGAEDRKKLNSLPFWRDMLIYFAITLAVKYIF